MGVLQLIPGRVYLEAAAAAALLSVFAWYTHHERALGVAHELAAVQTASAKVQAAAQKAIQTTQNDYQTKLEAIKGEESAKLQSAAADSASLSSRLRDYEARNSRACPALGSSTPASAGAAAGAGRDPAVEAGIDAVIAALEHDDQVIAAERAERDSLTGK